jgi:hypothetical protein
VATGIWSSTLPAPTFCGNHLRDVGRNGQLRDPDVNKLLETTARTKVARYREAYAHPTGRAPATYAFLPCVMSTSDRIRGEFLHLLYILAHRRTLKNFAVMGEAEPGTDAYTWRRSQYLCRHKAAIGFGNACAHRAPPACRMPCRPDAALGRRPDMHEKVVARQAHVRRAMPGALVPSPRLLRAASKLSCCACLPLTYVAGLWGPTCCSWLATAYDRPLVAL